MRKEHTSYFPAFLNLTGRKCVVVGGGQIALRRARALLERGAGIEVISPEFCSGLEKLAEAGQISAVRRHYRAGDLEGAFIAVAATDDRRINLAVAKEAGEKGVLVNVVDDPDSSDFIVPSCVCRGDLTIAISTAGRSPALARKIRARLERDFGSEYAALALLLDEVRSEIKGQGIIVTGDDWQKALDLDLMLDLLKKGDQEKARAILVSKLKMARK